MKDVPENMSKNGMCLMILSFMLSSKLNDRSIPKRGMHIDSKMPAGLWRQLMACVRSLI